MNDLLLDYTTTESNFDSATGRTSYRVLGTLHGAHVELARSDNWAAAEKMRKWWSAQREQPTDD